MKTCGDKTAICAGKKADLQEIVKENEALKREVDFLKKVIADKDYINILQIKIINDLKSKNSLSVSREIINNSSLSISYSQAARNVKKGKEVKQLCCKINLKMKTILW